MRRKGKKRILLLLFTYPLSDRMINREGVCGVLFQGTIQYDPSKSKHYSSRQKKKKKAKSINILILEGREKPLYEAIGRRNPCIWLIGRRDSSANRGAETKYPGRLRRFAGQLDNCFTRK